MHNSRDSGLGVGGRGVDADFGGGGRRQRGATPGRSWDVVGSAAVSCKTEGKGPNCLHQVHVMNKASSFKISGREEGLILDAQIRSVESGKGDDDGGCRRERLVHAAGMKRRGRVRRSLMGTNEDAGAEGSTERRS